MKYEIITDNKNLLILIVNDEVREISRYMPKILDTIAADYEENQPKEVEAPQVKDKSPKLGPLFNL